MNRTPFKDAIDRAKENGDYQFGDAVGAAVEIEAKLDQIEKLIKDARNAGELAGEFLEPGIRYALRKRLQSMIEQRL